MKYFPNNIQAMDKRVGQLVNFVNQLGIRNNTLIMFTGDNGCSHQVVSTLQSGEKVTGGKSWPRSAGTHVPLIASWPAQLPEGVVDHTLVDFTDFMNTMAQVMGAPSPTTDGYSFLLNSGQKRDAVFLWFRRVQTNELFIHARDAKYKLTNAGKFYNTVQDPKEQHPLTNLTSAEQSVRSRLQNTIDKYLAPYGGGGGSGSDTTDDLTGTVTTRGELYGRFGEYAFDNNTNTKWVDLRPSVSTPSWIQYQYAGGERFVIDSYTLTSGDDVPGRDPRDWELRGSHNGGATWTVVDSRQNQTFSSRRQLRSFDVNSPGAYNVYRLHIERVADASQIKVQLSEIELLGEAGGGGGDGGGDTTTGLVSYYAFAGNVHDTAPFGKSADHGTLIGNARLADGGGGSLALEVDGNGDVLLLPASLDVNRGTHTAQTVSLWFRARQPGAGGRQVIYEQGGSERGMNVYLEDGSLNAGAWNQDLWSGTWLLGSFLPNGWNHVVLVLNASASSNQLRLYVNGVPQGAGQASLLTGHNPAALGAVDVGSRYYLPSGFENSQADNGFNGFIDDVRIFDRALTADDVLALASGAP